ncbi:uncharacterized protein LOC124910330 [Impatiens glandulifera]|uniref:uncharacterized protein LOC124910330 n=1 Tax=Impatiens glandulifera TaxID=253017 RepID=UPI001FB151A4|nr:uncharacterized protein LOC124910330 [Impatiens glandulifera]
MEPNNIPMTTKGFWNILRGVLLVLRNGAISKRKLLMFDLNIMFKRGKLASKNMMHNLVFHHHNHNHNHNHNQIPSTPSFVGGPDEYEFSCDNTPAHTSFPLSFLVSKRKQHGAPPAHSNFFSCANAPQTVEEDINEDDYAIAQSPAMAAFLRSPMAKEIMYEYNSEASSPALPGFGRTPMVRQLRITDSPYQINDIGDVENSRVDAKADEFIAMFYEQLRKQNSMGRRMR